MNEGVRPPKSSLPKQLRRAGAKALEHTHYLVTTRVRRKPAPDGSGVRRAGEAMRRQRLREMAAPRAGHGR
jgi:hypothetical protein